MALAPVFKGDAAIVLIVVCAGKKPALQAGFLHPLVLPVKKQAAASQGLRQRIRLVVASHVARATFFHICLPS
jgi:hypothetical protein